ncbi:UNVERIFIED_CONTAM: hypothetical protein GTU68_012546 [Idotea baltica]|nr:hypothetical protein [Idotea baltica]
MPSFSHPLGQKIIQDMRKWLPGWNPLRKSKTVIWALSSPGMGWGSRSLIGVTLPPSSGGTKTWNTLLLRRKGVLSGTNHSRPGWPWWNGIMDLRGQNKSLSPPLLATFKFAMNSI